MRTALTISAVAHVLMWVPVVLSLPEPLAAPVETPIMAEIVAPDEFDKTQQKSQEQKSQEQKSQQPPPAQEPTQANTPTPPGAPPPKREDQAPSRQPPKQQKATKLAAASTSAPPPAAAEQPQQTPPQPPQQPVQTQVWGSWLDSALTSPLVAASTGMDPAEQGANISASDIAKFKAHLQSCWKRPEHIADGSKAMVVLRLSLQRNGALTKEPTLIAASGSEDGVAVMKAAMQAVRQCQPYGFLPPADYKEWKVLDLAFSPNGLSGLPRI